MKIEMPCLNTKLVPVEKVKANEYNPNKVASKEMDLLELSIKLDGVTMPVVVYHDKEKDIYEVVDGFHRFTVLSKRLKQNYIPVSIIDKPLDERMGSTVRHNRARGTHQIRSMSDIVVDLTTEGWSDNDIAKKMGMELDEVIRLKQISGLKQAFNNHNFSKSWIDFNRKYKKEIED